MLNRNIFRKVMLDRLSSPDSLDELMEVTPPRAWVALTAVWLLLGVGFMWSIFGELPTSVNGTGLLIHSGGLNSVVATASGQLAELSVERGDIVEVGQVVAQISQPHLLDRIHESEAQMSELQRKLQRLESSGDEEQEIRAGLASQRRASLTAEINAARERKVMAENSLQTQQKLFKKGLTTKQALNVAVMQAREAKDAILRLNADRKRISLDVFSSKQMKEANISSLKGQITEAQVRLNNLETQLKAASEVVSRYRGRVMEVRYSPGVVVRTGATVVSLEAIDDEVSNLEVLLYMSAADGKRVKVGDTAQVVPSVVKREEHGVLVGTVNSVAEFPATRIGMTRVLGNEELVKNFLETTGGAPIAVVIELTPNEELPAEHQETHSGYRWSSGHGPPLKLSSGTPCNASIHLEYRRPIGLLLPGIRERLGL